MQQYLQNKKGLVQNVFNQVYDKYDIMNDLMSLGVHRFWKKSLINMMNPSTNSKLVDVACGTGDIGKLFLDNTNKNGEIVCVDPNQGMIDQGKQKLLNYKNIKWINSSAEKLPLENNIFDFYTIGFGLRNTKDLEKTLSEAYRILKPGGTIVFADTPQDDLFTYRGFYEPWKDQWLNFDCEQSLKSAGFTDIVDHGIVGGDGKVRSIQEHKEKDANAEDSTDNRLFLFTAKKSMKASL